MSPTLDRLLCREVSADLKLLLSSLDPVRGDSEPWMQSLEGGQNSFGSPESLES